MRNTSRTVVNCVCGSQGRTQHLEGQLKREREIAEKYQHEKSQLAEKERATNERLLNAEKMIDKLREEVYHIAFVNSFRLCLFLLNSLSVLHLHCRFMLNALSVLPCIKCMCVYAHREIASKRSRGVG